MKDIYVKFNKPLNGKDIKGESRDAGTGQTHPAPWFEATSWQHFIRQPKSATASTAGGNAMTPTNGPAAVFGPISGIAPRASPRGSCPKSSRRCARGSLAWGAIARCTRGGRRCRRSSVTR